MNSYQKMIKAIDEFAESFGDRHKAGIVIRGVSANYLDRSRMLKPMTPDEIHELNVKTMQGGYDREARIRQHEADKRAAVKRAIEQLGIENILILMTKNEDYCSDDIQFILWSIGCDGVYDGDDILSEQDFLAKVKIPENVDLRFSQPERARLMKVEKELFLNADSKEETKHE